MSKDKLTLAERNKLDALTIALLECPPYPVGTKVRQMQDELEELRRKAK